MTGPPRVARELNDGPWTNVVVFQLQRLRCSKLAPDQYRIGLRPHLGCRLAQRRRLGCGRRQRQRRRGATGAAADLGHNAGQIGALRPEGGLVLHLIGPSVSSIAQLRSTGMQATKPANIQIRTLAGDWSEQSGYKAVTRWLQLKTSGDTPVTLVAAQNDDMAMGARRAFEDQTSGAQRERWTNLPYIGCDCCPGAGREWVRKGLLTASITNPSTAGLALEIMVQAIRTNTQPAERTMVEPASHPSVETLAGTLTQTGAS